MAGIAGLSESLSNFIDSLKSLNDEDTKKGLEKLSTEWAQRYEFGEMDSAKKASFVDGLCYHMENISSSDTCKRLCLELVRLLSRDKIYIEGWIDNRLIRILVNFAGFTSSGTLDLNTTNIDPTLSLEAQKALCNLTFQSEKARRFCIACDCLEGMGHRLRQPLHNNLDDYDRIFYDLRFLFLLTALCPDVRPKCRDEPVDGLRSLTEILDTLVNGNYTDIGERSKNEKISRQLLEKEVNLVCETLKVAFNLVLPYKMTELKENEAERLNRLVDVLRQGLFVKLDDTEKREELHSNIINMFAALPSQCYERLTPKLEGSVSSHSPIPIYDGRNMEASQILLDFLNSRLDKPAREQLESLSPILTLLIDMARKYRHLRKYMRFKVLPPLTDVMTRPEEGSTIRNKLVRLMTSVTTEIKDLAADYLFELCNRSIDRLIKYTGFGNAAGMLSTHGLMGAAISGRSAASGKDDDDDNSDTEEYLRVRDEINPIIGCYEAPRPDPMAGMSEEQKEYEAMKLVEQIDKLMRGGVVVPGRLGEDGRVYPVEHMLQLVEDAERSGVIRRQQESSNDDEVDD